MNEVIPLASRTVAPVAPAVFNLMPSNLDEAFRLADMMAQSDLVPKTFKGNPGNCFVAMQWGFEVGMKPLQALQNIAVINGKPGIFGDAGKAILLAHGCIIEEDDTAVVRQNNVGRCKITRPGRPPVERTFSLDDAKTAGLWGKEGPWKTYPFRQMAWRAFWFAARDAAADLLRGLAGAEELLDFAVATDPLPPPPPADPVAWPDDKFAAQFERYEKAVIAGLKTRDEIVALAKSKGALSPEQEGRIRAIVVTAPTNGDTVAGDAQ